MRHLSPKTTKMKNRRYHSDLAVQVTFMVPEAQQFTINFANNNLKGVAMAYRAFAATDGGTNLWASYGFKNGPLVLSGINAFEVCTNGQSLSLTIIRAPSTTPARLNRWICIWMIQRLDLAPMRRGNSILSSPTPGVACMHSLRLPRATTAKRPPAFA